MTEEREEHKGVNFYTTTDGVRVMRLHYSADPDKDPDTEEGRAWLLNQLRGYPGGAKGAKWRREMEIDFSVRGTNKVWPNFSEMQVKIVTDPIDIPEHWPIWAGFDHGTANPFSFIAVAFETEEKAIAFDEIYQTGLSAYDQAKLIRQRPYFSRLRGIIGDTSIWKKDQNDGTNLTSVGEMMAEFGVYIDKANKFEGIDAAFIHMLNGIMWQNLEEPRLRITSNCENLLKELRNVRWKEYTTVASRENNPEYEKIVTRNVDAFDALKYVILSQWRGTSIEEMEVLPDTFEWFLNRIEEASMQDRYVLR